MKILIVSDTHGRHDGIEQAIQREKPLDLVIHLGDILGYEDYYQALAGCPLEAVAGNNDFMSDLPREKELQLDGMHIWLTHGHQYDVYYDFSSLIRVARAKKADIVMFGHIHRPVLQKEKGLTLVNPGSLTYPRQRGHRPSYIVMTKEMGQVPEYRIKYL